MSRRRERPMAGGLRRRAGLMPRRRASSAPFWRRPAGARADAAALALVRAGDWRRAKPLLRERSLYLSVDRLPGGLVWVIAPGWRSGAGNDGLLAALRRLAATRRLVFSLDAFWQLAAREWWAAGRYDELDRRLSGALVRYDPVCYLIWGRRLALLDHPKAGMYLLLSGLYEPHEAPLVERFKERCRRMGAAQVASLFPGPARLRQSRHRFPERVLADLAETPAPAWLQRRPRRP